MNFNIPRIASASVIMRITCEPSKETADACTKMISRGLVFFIVTLGVSAFAVAATFCYWLAFK